MGTERRRGGEDATGRLEGGHAQFARLLMEIDTSDLEAAVDRAISLLATRASADRCVLWLGARDDSGRPLRFDWTAPGVEAKVPLPHARELERFAWAVARLESGQPICIDDVEDLPPEAAEEAQAMRDGGIASAMTLPVRRDGRTAGFLVLQRFRERRGWSDQDVAWMQLAADLLVNSVERNRAERALADQLALEQRIAALSQRFLELRSDGIDEGIRQSLDLVLEVSGADRAYLVAIEPVAPFIQEVWERTRPGIPGVTERIRPIRPHRFRWTTRMIERGQVIRIEDPEALGPEAALERDELCERGVRSALGIPVHSDGSLVGCLTVEFLRAPHRFRNAEITRMRLVADMLASARRRQRAESALARQLAAEQTIANLSRRFMATSSPEIADTVVDGLREAAELARSDRALLVFFDRVNARPRTYEWRAPGVEAVPHVESARRWAIERVMQGETLRYGDVSTLPDEADAMRRMLLERGVRSLLGLPVFSGDHLVGYMGFEALREQQWWSDQEVTLFGLLGELLTSALQRHTTEQALRESQTQLIQSQKMEAVGRLAGGIAHDFNNLLTVILGFSRALMGELEADHWAREDVCEIHEAAERAAGLTRQLLTFSRQRQCDHRAVELGGTVRGLEEMLRRLLGEDVELEIAIDGDEFWVKADPHQVEQVLVNLAVNARDAMPDGGTLAIAIEPRHIEERERRRHGLRRAGPHVALVVRDTGVGLDEDMRERIFEPFFTTKEPGKGTGLGLSIVYSVVEQADGAIAVQGGPAKGTAFVILLPLLAEQPQPNAGKDPSGQARGTGTILLVEDEKAVRRLARRILERGGYRVLEARDGVDALEVARSTSEPIDLLLTDVVMPRMGGGELARRLQCDRPDTRVLFVSGYPQDRREGSVEAPEEGRFLYKPFSAQSLLGEVRSALDGDEEGGAAPA